MNTKNLKHYEQFILSKLKNELIFANKYKLNVRAFTYQPEYLKNNYHRAGSLKWHSKSRTIFMETTMVSQYMAADSSTKKEQRQINNFYYKFMFWHEMAHLIENRGNGKNDVNDFNKPFKSLDLLSEQSLINEIEVFKIQYHLMRHVGYNPTKKALMPMANVNYIIDLLVSRIIKKNINEAYPTIYKWFEHRIPDEDKAKIAEYAEHKIMSYDPILAEFYMKELDEVLNELSNKRNTDISQSI